MPELFMKTYFARHTLELDIDATTRRLLWDGRHIAVHFPQHGAETKVREVDNASLDPADYAGSGRRAMEALVELSTEGGYVCAQYAGYDDCLVGVVLPKSRIELVSGQWGGHLYPPTRPAILKALRLDRAALLKPEESVRILIGRPRQGTLMRWPSAGTMIQDLVEGTWHTRLPTLRDLLPPQQEIMCSEFLRLPEALTHGLPGLAHLLLPPGRTMKDVDVYGIALDGKRLFAQVTFGGSEAVHEKFERLRKYAVEDAHVLLFCDIATIRKTDGIFIVPMTLVFSAFCATRFGQTWLSRSR
jgi:hypothetical protein